MRNSQKSVWAQWHLVMSVVALLGAAVAPTAGQKPQAKQVYVAIYERGPAWVKGKSVRELPAFPAHLAHIRSLEPQLLGAGPFAGAPGESLTGMLVFVASNDDEAQRLAESDPFVKAKYTRVMKVIRWQVQGLKGCP